MKKEKTNNNDSLLENSQLRNDLVERIDVLDKVKELFLLPKLECLTIKQVAEYYEVDIEAVQKCYARNKAEINSDGAAKTSVKSMISLFGQDVQIEVVNHAYEFKLSEDVTLRVPNVGITLFPKRAILRIGMLLRDSEIAKEVRTQLLNVFEETQENNPELLTKELDGEREMVVDVVKAYMTGDMLTFAEATMNLNQFYKRHIEKLQRDNELLVSNLVKLPMRSEANRLVRMLACELHINYKFAWNWVYKQLNYKYGINLKNRGEKKQPFIQYLQDNEFPQFQSVISSIVAENGISPDDFFDKCKIIHTKQE